MAAKSNPSESANNMGNGFQSLPFEPKGKKDTKGKKKESVKAPGKSQQQTQAVKKQTQSPAQSAKVSKGKAKPSAPIPDVVSKRMAKRMVTFCGIPTLLGLTTFPVSYALFQRGIELPNVAVLLVSLGGLGLGVLGLSYGVLSASWDEELAGSALGWPEFLLNIGRVREGWKEARDRKNG